MLGIVNIIAGIGTIWFGLGIPSVIEGLILLVAALLTMLGKRRQSPGLQLSAMVMLVCPLA